MILVNSLIKIHLRISKVCGMVVSIITRSCKLRLAANKKELPLFPILVITGHPGLACIEDQYPYKIFILYPVNL
jgi:hypothetical protein